MGDIAIVFDPVSFTGDFAMSGAGLLLGNELQTAVLISLFTDGVASPDDIMPPSQVNDPRGWWADTYTNDPIGSKLWQAFWRQTTPGTVNWLNDTANKAVQWMLDDGVASSVTVNAQLLGPGRIGFSGTIIEPSGRPTPFSWVWKQEG